MTDLRIESAAAVGDLADRWSPLATSLYSSADWLATSESPAITRRYLILSHRDGDGPGEPAALVATSRIDQPGGWIFGDPIALLLGLAGAPEQSFAPQAARRLSRLREGLTPDDLYPATLCALSSGYLPGIVTAPGAPAADVAAALTQVERQAAEWVTKSTSVLYVPERDRILRAALAGRGYLAFTPLAECVLPVAGWTAFEDYLASLRSARRNSVRHEIAAFDASGATFAEVSVHALGQGHAGLHIEHMRGYGHELAADRILSLFGTIGDLFADTATVIELREDDALLGFLLIYHDRGWVYPKMLGLCPSAQRPPYAYFNLGYYETIRYAIRTGRAGIIFGPEAYEVKALRGIWPEPRTIFLRPPAGTRDQVAAVVGVLDEAHRHRFAAYPWRARTAT